MDVRTKQRLCYRVALFPFAYVLTVSPHVISNVIHYFSVRVSALLNKTYEAIAKDACEIVLISCLIH